MRDLPSMIQAAADALGVSYRKAHEVLAHVGFVDLASQALRRRQSDLDRKRSTREGLNKGGRGVALASKASKASTAVELKAPELKKQKPVNSKYHPSGAYAPETTGRAAIDKDFGILAEDLGAILDELDVDHKRERPGGDSFVALDRWVRRRLATLAVQKRDGWGRYDKKKEQVPIPANERLLNFSEEDEN